MYFGLLSVSFALSAVFFCNLLEVKSFRCHMTPFLFKTWMLHSLKKDNVIWYRAFFHCKSQIHSHPQRVFSKHLLHAPNVLGCDIYGCALVEQGFMRDEPFPKHLFRCGRERLQTCILLLESSQQTTQIS